MLLTILYFSSVFVTVYLFLFFFFFFSSRRRHTRCYRDWSSDVCSSDLPSRLFCTAGTVDRIALAVMRCGSSVHSMSHSRSEERRVGKECRSRWSADH